MLNKKFKHSTYFQGENMTVKQFLDYVLSNPSNWIIKNQSTINGGLLLSEPEHTYYLTCYDNGRTRSKYKLDTEDAKDGHRRGVIETAENIILKQIFQAMIK